MPSGNGRAVRLGASRRLMRSRTASHPATNLSINRSANPMPDMPTKKKPPCSKNAKPPRKPTKPATKTVGGRPSLYRPAYAKQAHKLALLGFTDAKIANFFEVTEQTVNNWKHDHPEFFESLKSGKEDADARIAAALYHSALGGGTITEMREELDAGGNAITKKTVKELPANVTAQIFWLKNRQPHAWREKVVVEETPPETIAQTAFKYMEIMERARARQRQVLIDRGILKPDD